MLRFIIFLIGFIFTVQCLPKGAPEENPTPGYKRGSLLEANVDIIKVAPLSLELQQRYQIDHADEVNYADKEHSSSGKASKVLKMNLPKQESDDANNQKMRTVVGMDEKGMVRMMQIPKYSREDALEQ